MPCRSYAADATITATNAADAVSLAGFIKSTAIRVTQPLVFVIVKCQFIDVELEIIVIFPVSYDEGRIFSLVDDPFGMAPGVPSAGASEEHFIQHLRIGGFIVSSPSVAAEHSRSGLLQLL